MGSSRTSQGDSATIGKEAINFSPGDLEHFPEGSSTLKNDLDLGRQIRGLTRPREFVGSDKNGNTHSSFWQSDSFRATRGQGWKKWKETSLGKCPESGKTMIECVCVFSTNRFAVKSLKGILG